MKLNDTTRNAAAYIRVARTQDKSLAEQLLDCRAQAVVDQLTLSNEGVFADDFVAGRLALHKRPGFKELLAAAKRHSFNYLIIDELSRLSRSVNEVLAVVSDLSRCGITIRIASPEERRKQ